MDTNLVFLFAMVLPSVISITPRCYDPFDEALECDSVLMNRLNETLYTSFNITYDSIDQSNTQELKMLVEETKNFMCNPSNFDKIECILDKIKECPLIRGEPLTDATYFASEISKVITATSTTATICDHYKNKHCKFREQDLNDCYTHIVGDLTTTDIDPTHLCVEQTMDDVDCILDKYGECWTDIDIDDNQVLASSIKQNMTSHKWQTFTSGTELCRCYEGLTCYYTMKEQISRHTVTENSVRDKYLNTMLIMEEFCRDSTAVMCSSKKIKSQCKDMIEDFEAEKIKIVQYEASVGKICDEIVSSEVQNNWDCIIDRFSDEFRYCIDRARIPDEVVSCSFVQEIYDCVKYAFPSRRCSGDYLNFAYEIVRVKYGNLPVCTVSGVMATVPSESVIIILTTLSLLFVIYVIG
ncbi:hypothetical protein ACF0H5_010207 [Mactra antiquata]